VYPYRTGTSRISYCVVDDANSIQKAGVTMTQGRNGPSFEIASQAAPSQLYRSRIGKRRRWQVVDWVVVFFLCVSLCSLSLPCIVQYLRSQFPPPAATPTQVGVIAPAPTPSPTPSPDPTAIPSPTPSPSPMPTPTPVTPAVVSSKTDHYIGLILQNDPEAHHLAYSMLSPQQMQQISFSAFEHDRNYTLLPGCWRVVQVSSPTLQKDGVTWETGAILEYMPYGGKAVETFYWHFQWLVEQGQLVIVAIGLYPTGVDTSARLPC